MKLLVLTSDAQRHKFVANTLAREELQTRVVSEQRPAGGARAAHAPPVSPALEEHLRQRNRAEMEWFAGHEVFRAETRHVGYGQLNDLQIVEAIHAWRPEACVVFGTSVIRQPLLGGLPEGLTINLHLGLSPYYRGSGTNFWPFVNGEPEYVGATLLHLDAGVDTGPIIAHVRPQLEPDDTAHTAGCRVIALGVLALLALLRLVRAGCGLPAVAQWPVAQPRYYRERDVTEETLATYHQRLREGVVERYLAGPARPIRLVPLPRAWMVSAALGDQALR